MAAKSGKLVVTQRAISQDAEQAMRGDPVRALIELITNADDAYQGGEAVSYTHLTLPTILRV